jgi:hypothetical protein
MSDPTFMNLGPRQRQILANSNIPSAMFDGLSKYRRAAFFDITFALAMRARLRIDLLRLKNGAEGIHVDRLFFAYRADLIDDVRANTDDGSHTFKLDTFEKHDGITDAVRQTTAFMSIQIGWAVDDKIEIDIDVGNPQNAAGVVMHALELINNKALGKVGRFLRIPGVRDHTDHTVIMKMLDAQPV